MALANVACLLARELSNDQKVLAIDWDLEAPGLHYYLGQLGAANSIAHQPGVVELFTRMGESLVAAAAGDDEEDSAADKLLNTIDISGFVHPTRAPNVHLMPAGRMDETYQSRLMRLDWEDIYNRCPAIYRAFARRLAREYAFVLVDSRTGMTDISSVCTALLPDKVVVVFTPNRQSLTGIESLVRRSTEYRQASKDLRPLMVYPLPSRIDNQFDTLRNLWRHGDSAQDIEGYQSQFERVLTQAYALTQCDLSTYCEEVQIQHSPEHSYGETVAALDHASEDRFSIVWSYRALINWLRASAAPWERPQTALARRRLEQLIAEDRSDERQFAQAGHRRIRRLEEIVVLSRSTHGDEHPETFAAIERLIDASLDIAEERPRAIDLLDELVRGLASLGGPQRWGTIECLLRSAGTLRELGDDKVAERLLAASLDAVDRDEQAFTAHGLSFPITVAGRLSDAKKFNEARHLLVRIVETQRRVLGEEHPDTATSLNNLAATLEAQGDLMAALAAYKEVLKIARAVAEHNPANPQSQRELSALYNKLGDLMRMLADVDQARHYYEAALQIRERLVQTEPDRAIHQRELSASYEGLGDLMRMLADVDQARHYYEAALQIRERLVQTEPDRAIHQRELSASYERLGDLMRMLARVDQARHYYEAALQIRERLVQTEPDRVIHQRELSASYDRLGDMMQMLGDRQHALHYYEAALQIRERLVQTEPHRAIHQRELSASYERLGDMMQMLENMDAARSYFLRSLQIREGLAQAEPQRVNYQRDLSIGYDRIGDVLMRKCDLGGALDAYRQSLAIAATLVKRDPANVQWQRDLSISYMRIGDALMQKNDLGGALDAYRQSLVIAETVVKRDPANVQWQRDLSISYMRIGDALMQKNDLGGALDPYRQGLAIAEAVAERDPANAQWQHDLSRGQDRMGDLLVQGGDLAGALAAYRRGLTTIEALTERYPGSSTWQHDRSLRLSKIADVLVQLGDLAGARALQEQVLAECRRVLGEGHPDTLAAMKNLVSTLLSLGDLESAHDLQAALLAAQRRSFDGAQRSRPERSSEASDL